MSGECGLSAVEGASSGAVQGEDLSFGDLGGKESLSKDQEVKCEVYSMPGEGVVVGDGMEVQAGASEVYSEQGELCAGTVLSGIGGMQGEDLSVGDLDKEECKLKDEDCKCDVYFKPDEVGGGVLSISGNIDGGCSALVAAGSGLDVGRGGRGFLKQHVQGSLWW